MEVKYISENYLNDIKSQGLACVEQTSEQTTNETEEENNETPESIENLNVPDNSIQESNIKKPIIFDTISLNPKDIKSINGEEKLESIDNYAIYGFTAFCILIAVLFMIKIRKRKFSEFK